MSSINILIEYLDTSIGSTSDQWRCISFINKAKVQCNNKFGKKEKNHLKDQARKVHGLLQELQTLQDAASIERSNILEEAKPILEKLTCYLHHKRVMGVVEGNSGSKSTGKSGQSTASQPDPSDPAKDAQPKGEYFNQKAPGRIAKPSGPRQTSQALDAIPVTPLARQEGVTGSLGPSIRCPGFSSPQSDVSTPESSQESVFDYTPRDAGFSPLTPDSTASNLSTYSSRTYSSQTPTKPRRQIAANQAKPEDVDDFSNGFADYLDSPQFGGRETKSITGISPLNLPASKVPLSNNPSEKSGKTKQDAAGKATAASQIQKTQPRGDRTTAFRKDQVHTGLARFHVAKLIEQDLGPSDKEDGHLYIAEGFEPDDVVDNATEKKKFHAVEGHYKLGWTRKNVSDRYKGGCKRNLRFHYRSPTLIPSAHRVERLIQEDLCLERRRVKDCSWCSNGHDEWFQVNLGVLRESVERWTRFLLLPAYTKDGTLSEKARGVLLGMWTWNDFVTAMAKGEKEKVYYHDLGVLYPPVRKRDLPKVEAEFEIKVKARALMPPQPTGGQEESERVKSGVEDGLGGSDESVQSPAEITHAEQETASDRDKENWYKPLGDNDKNRKLTRPETKSTVLDDSFPRRVLQKSGTWANVQASKAKSYPSELYDGFKRRVSGKGKASAADAQSLTGVDVGELRLVEPKMGIRRRMTEGWKAVKFRL
ncbi:hypothetical protein PT974_07396 [Cladobotryum mycophilum]|uniref:Bacteriophage T5 Orf172 DNA-binding domain-containing protein n=1 Tax=Cladobotryum mycophilum TaxID=491253 RepID=A0ABR0SP49_9HYPO